VHELGLPDVQGFNGNARRLAPLVVAAPACGRVRARLVGVRAGTDDVAPLRRSGVAQREVRLGDG
jgi:hypothetical protein